MTTELQPDTRLRGRWLTTARLLWLALVLVAVGLLAAGTVEKYPEPFPVDCTEGGTCNPIELTTADLALVPGKGLSTPAFASLWITLNLLWNLSFVAMAGLIFWRRSDDWIALVLSLTLALLGAVAFSPANFVLPMIHPEWRPATEVWEKGAYVSLLLLLLIFPDGRFVPRWTRLAVPLLLVFGATSLPVLAVGVISIVGIAIYAQIYRYRRVSNALQRQQTKWVSSGLIATVSLMVIWLICALAFPPEQPTVTRTYFLLVITPVYWLIGLFFQASIAIAVLRYRLWDIDIIIRRTLVYSVLTTMLALVYFGSVVALQSLFRAVGGRQSPVVTVLSTLAIAALFAPLRRRVQDTIDRRYYRKKYDAARVVAEFAATCRDETDLDKLTARLVEVVQETMQPEHVSLWLRKSGDAQMSQTQRRST